MNQTSLNSRSTRVEPQRFSLEDIQWSRRCSKGIYYTYKMVPFTIDDVIFPLMYTKKQNELKTNKVTPGFGLMNLEVIEAGGGRNPNHHIP